MADKAHAETDRLLEQMERRLSVLYSGAEKFLKKDLSYFFEKLKPEADAILEEWKNSGSDEAKRKYISYFKKIAKSKEFKELSEAVAEEMYKANVEATKRINAQAVGIYTINYNYIGRRLGRDLYGYTFRPVSDEDASLYGGITRQDIDKDKDASWNRKNVSTAVVVGAILMLSPDRIAKRAAKTTAKKNQNSANLHARGMYTDAESKGRLDSMCRARDEGHQIEKYWQSTLDNRTRDSHRELDGTTVPLDEDFTTINGNKLSRPRDPNGAMEEICNCRCTLQYRVGQKSGATRAARFGDVKGSYKKSGSFRGTRTETVKEMTYREWMEWRKS